MTENEPELVRDLAAVSRDDGAVVGGKNASLGEMIGRLREAGIRVPGGFAVTAAAYWALLDANRLREPIAEELERLHRAAADLPAVGAAVRQRVLEAEVPDAVAGAILAAYREMRRRAGQGARRAPLPVAVRSSATAEDLPEASFAGQLETFLNVRGEERLLDAYKRCCASLFTDRAISYRENRGFDHLKVALSVGVQSMVRSDRAGSGVMFSIDTESGFPRIALINAAWGLGETVVQGTVDPDEYQVFKPLLDDPALAPIVEKRRGAKARKMVYARGSKDAGGAPTKVVATSRKERAGFVLSDPEILQLARWACAVESHYGQPMDLEWAKDGTSGELFVVQARPETVQSHRAAGTLESYRLESRGERLLAGLAIGDSIAAGKVCRLDSAADVGRFEDGAVLVTGMTDPDWVPIMKRAAALVTDHGGRTSHAAIVSRELGLTALVGTGDATERLAAGAEVTVSCAEGATGFVYAGIADIEVRDVDPGAVPETRTAVMVNLADPDSAFRWWRLPIDGVGLARMEFIIGNHIQVHPMALAHFDRVEDARARRAIERLTAGFADKTEYFVDRLARGIARIAAAYHPKPVILRTSDFKTNEYADLAGGERFEPREENPMLGWRGASRYYHEGYRDGFALECRAIRRVREEMGLANVVVMIPFCRSPAEADRVLAELSANGLVRGKAGLEVFVMAEIPANVFLAARFAERFDGFSIGSNDLTQLVLGVDRDSDVLADLFDERDEAVTEAIGQLLAVARAGGVKTGICGQAPSDHPEFAEYLVEHGIDSISVSPDRFLAVKEHVAAAEARLARPGGAAGGAAGGHPGVAGGPGAG